MDNFVMFTCFLGECIGRFTNRKIPYCVKFNPDEVLSFHVFFFNFITQELKILEKRFSCLLLLFFVIVVIVYICSVMKRSDVSYAKVFIFLVLQGTEYYLFHKCSIKSSLLTVFLFISTTPKTVSVQTDKATAPGDSVG